VVVVVEMLTGCGVEVVVVAVAVAVVVVVAVAVAVVVVVVVAVAVAVGLDTRIQQRTPRLRLLAPSTPVESGAGGSFLITSPSRDFGLGIAASIYSVPANGMKRSNPESCVSIASVVRDDDILRLWSLIFSL